VGRVYARELARQGLRASPHLLGRRFRKALAESSELAFGPLAPSVLKKKEKRWWKELVGKVVQGMEIGDFQVYFESLFSFYATPAAWRLKRGAIEVLERLRNRGLKTLVVTNFDSRAFGLLEALGLMPLLDLVAVSSTAGVAKPNPEIFRQAAAKLGLEPAEVMHVGDQETNDAAAARAAGMRPVLLCGKASNRRSFEAITSLTELETLLGPTRQAKPGP
jgi:haloacid dehalogenase superfamily, subfamily IA, variant 3 with third motif having DD or ED/haloacid dehalogenase superfamily, subfamily IA, variant 1 with third motif having Dx(3-4)D or Dx(3-4)E